MGWPSPVQTRSGIDWPDDLQAIMPVLVVSGHDKLAVQSNLDDLRALVVT